MCSVGYTYSQTAVKCVPCNSEGSLLSFFNLIVLIFVFLIFLLAAHSVSTFRANKTVRDLDDYQLFLLVKIGVCSSEDFENNRENLRLYLINLRSRLEQISKTYIVLFQVINLIQQQTILKISGFLMKSSKRDQMRV